MSHDGSVYSSRLLMSNQQSLRLEFFDCLSSLINVNAPYSFSPCNTT
jgi:hypothetical protein